MSLFRVLLFSRYNDKTVYLCTDESSNFLSLLFSEDTCVGSLVTQDFLLGVGHAHSWLVEGMSLSGLEGWARDVVPIKGIKTKFQSLDQGACHLSFVARKKVLFQKVFASEEDAQMVADSYLGALQGWQLTKLATVVRVPVKSLIERSNDSQSARILRFPNSQGGGVALGIIRHGKPIFMRLGLFPHAVDQGNAFVPLDPPQTVFYKPGHKEVRFGPELLLEERENDEPIEQEPSGTTLQLGVYSYQQNLVQTFVIPVKSGYKIAVHLGGRKITEIRSDHNEGGYPYPLPQAIKRAQGLLEKLQGWVLSPFSSGNENASPG